MNVSNQIELYISSHTEPQKSELKELHNIILELFSGCTLWFLDGKNESGKIVSNPNIGYGNFQINSGKPSSRDFYQTGISANTTGISVYIFGIKDKNYLSDTYKATLGKANVSGYCIKFKSINDINIEVLKTAILDGFQQSNL